MGIKISKRDRFVLSRKTNMIIALHHVLCRINQMGVPIGELCDAYVRAYVSVTPTSQL